MSQSNAALKEDFGALLEESVVVFTVVKFLGAAYIIFLGIQAIRHRRQKADAVIAPAARHGAWRTAWDGFVVGVTNVKTIIFLVAVLPLFVDHKSGGIPIQIMLLGVVFVIVALVSDSVWALVAGAARDWFAQSPKRIAALGATGGAMMIGLGAAVLFVGHDSA